MRKTPLVGPINVGRQRALGARQPFQLPQELRNVVSAKALAFPNARDDRGERHVDCVSANTTGSCVSLISMPASVVAVPGRSGAGDREVNAQNEHEYQPDCVHH